MTAPQPSFTVLGAKAVEFAAAPTLAFALEVTEPTEREIYTIALTCQINIDPAQRDHDSATRELLSELFGEPERWAQTTKSRRWLQASVLVPSFTGAAKFELPVLCNFDLELAATKYFYSLPDGDIPLTFFFSGTILYRGNSGEIQAAQVHWDRQSLFRLPVDTWKEMVTHYYPQRGWIGLHADTLAALSRYKAIRGLPTFDACVSALLPSPTAGAASAAVTTRTGD